MARIHIDIKSATAVALTATLCSACGPVFGTREYDGGRRPAERATGMARSSDEVRQVQQRLNDLNYGAGPVDGVWGRQSEGALRDFQHARGLDETGEINDRTLRALQTAAVPAQRQAAGAEQQASPPPAADQSRAAESREAQQQPTEQQSPASAQMTGEQIRNLQSRLNDLGYKAGNVDGIWGPQTQTALRSFQQSKGLQATGALDERTAKELGVERR